MSANAQDSGAGSELPETFEEFMKPKCRTCGDHVFSRFFDYGAHECVGCAHKEGRR